MPAVARKFVGDFYNNKTEGVVVSYNRRQRINGSRNKYRHEYRAVVLHHEIWPKTDSVFFGN